MDLADVLSWVRVIVRTSPVMFVTRTISAFVGKGNAPSGQTVALNGVAGNLVPCPLCTVRLVPLAAGLGAVATVEYAKFLWLSNACLRYVSTYFVMA